MSWVSATRPEQIRQAMLTAAELDRKWMGKAPQDSRYTPWMPFPAAEFVTMLAEAITEADGGTFLEIGCGIGTRMLMADVIFGLDVQGIERVPEYVEQARQLGLQVKEADAAGWDGYGNYDILWFNRPFRDRALEYQLERQVWEDMKPGAVVMCANLEAPPPSSRFAIVVDDWEARRGVWMKPPALT